MIFVTTSFNFDLFALDKPLDVAFVPLSVEAVNSILADKKDEWVSGVSAARLSFLGINVVPEKAHSPQMSVDSIILILEDEASVSNAIRYVHVFLSHPNDLPNS